ncbi:hypothetical protein RND81_10G205900 [Saponaria officinalis]|uniref:Uncharacterized protein n=1 Tax=Saponaria officinalis TaxID=3572 RepID=A0AAW1I5B6_SAPOF
MALRAALAKNLSSKMASLGSRTRSIGTKSGSLPKMKAYASTAGGEEGDASQGKPRARYTPVYVALGMISLAVVLGLHTAKQQFMHAPAVRVKKSRRETVPEVMEPEHVAKESENFMKKSLFRKVAHVQEFNTPLDDPIHGNPLTRDSRVESLKSVGVDPEEAAGDLRR